MINVFFKLCWGPNSPVCVLSVEQDTCLTWQYDTVDNDCASSWNLYVLLMLDSAIDLMIRSPVHWISGLILCKLQTHLSDEVSTKKHRIMRWASNFNIINMCLATTNCERNPCTDFTSSTVCSSQCGWPWAVHFLCCLYDLTFRCTCRTFDELMSSVWWRFKGNYASFLPSVFPEKFLKQVTIFPALRSRNLSLSEKW